MPKKGLPNLLVSGFTKGLGYRYSRLLNRGMNPTCMVLHVTNACNCRCVMCNIWKIKPENEITLEEIDRLFSSPLFKDLRCLGLTGGETFLKKDISEIIRVAIKRLPALRNIALPSNGYLTDIILREVNTMLGLIEESGKEIELSVCLSLDGIGKTHDIVRGIDGIFDRTVKTINELKKIENDKLLLNISHVVCQKNISALFDSYTYFKGLVDSVVFTPIMGGDLYKNTEDSESLSLCAKDRETTIQFFDKIVSEGYVTNVIETYHYKRQANLLATGKRSFPCTAGYRMIYVKPDGGVFPCIIVPDEFCMGNIRDGDIMSIWHGKKAKEVRRKLKSYEGCRACPSDCDFAIEFEDEFFSFTSFILRNPGYVKQVFNKIFSGKRA